MTPPGRDQEDIPEDVSTLIRLGTVIEVTLSPPRCRVRYGDPDDEVDAETPPIRWLVGRSGKTRKWSVPSLGEEVLLLSPDGQIGNAVALAGLVNAEHPAAFDQDLDGMVFEDGARLSYDPAAHALSAILPAGATAVIEAPGGLTIRGPVTVEGTITATEDVKVGNVSLKDHTHTGVQGGAAKSGPPSP